MQPFTQVQTEPRYKYRNLKTKDSANVGLQQRVEMNLQKAHAVFITNW